MEGRAFHSLLGGGLLAFKWGGGGLNTLLDESAPSTWVLGRARKLSHTLQIFTRRFNYPRSANSINNAQYIVHKTETHWGERHIRKGTPVIHHPVCDVQGLKTTRPTFLLECEGPVLGG